MKIAIFGLGKSGVAAFNALKDKENTQLFLVNEGDPKDWSCWEYLSAHIGAQFCYNQNKAQNVFANMDLIILSPGIPMDHPALRPAYEQEVEVISEIEFAFRNSDVPVIAITGTNGKTTTTLMVSHLLKCAGFSVFTGGNIGIPYSEILNSDRKYDYAVIEISSFQLETIHHFRPYISIILNVSESHGERYKFFKDYFKAKKRIYLNQQAGDYCIIHPDLDIDEGPFTKLLIDPLQDFQLDHPNLLGEHNRFNAYCAKLTYDIVVPLEKRKDVVELLKNFQAAPHRLHYLGDFNGLKVYDDAKSTNLESTRVAINTFKNGEDDLYLILGGKLRDDKFKGKEVLKGLSIKKILCIGEAAEKICLDLCDDFDVANLDNLVNVIKWVKREAPKGILLFSPAFPSFDQYSSYVERGEHFIQLIESLK